MSGGHSEGHTLATGLAAHGDSVLLAGNLGSIIATAAAPQQDGRRGRAIGTTPGAASITLSDSLVEVLGAHGVDTYFGVAGGAIEPLFNALARQERVGRARLVSMRSEAGAAFAADGFYRATGRPAVCTGTTGPGISNMITGLMSAHADRIPLLVLTPQVSQAKQGRGALQDSSTDGHDLTRMLRDCTRYSTAVTHPEQLPHKLARALWSLCAKPAGPVHLSIAQDILAGSSDRVPFDAARGPFTLGNTVDGAAVDRLVEAVAHASAPVFYVGDDAGMDAERLFEVARRHGGLVVSSPAGKHWIGHLDGNYRGVLGFSGHRSAALAAEQADVVVAFGATFDELSTNAWTVFGSAPVYAVDAHVEHFHRCAGSRPILASTAEVVRRLLEAPSARARRAAVPVAAPALREDPAEPRPGPVHPARLMDFLNRRLPEDVVVHVDAGNAFSWSTHHLTRALPATYRVAMGLSTMCWAIGAAVGAAVARSRRTLCIVGDGSMLMSSMELTVAVQHQLPITFVVLNDACYGMVRHGQQLSGAEPIGFELGHVAFDRLAQACGAGGVRVETEQDLYGLPDSCFLDDAGGPWVIDVVIDRDAVSPMIERVRGLKALSSG